MSSRVKKSANLQNIRRMRRDMEALSVDAARQVADRGATELTAQARAAFSSGQSVYGVGRSVTLVDTGNVRDTIAATTDGQRYIRFPMAPDTSRRVASKGPYMRYLIGRYGILPSGTGQEMPHTWHASMEVITKEALEYYSGRILA